MLFTVGCGPKAATDDGGLADTSSSTATPTTVGDTSQGTDVTTASLDSTATDVSVGASTQGDSSTTGEPEPEPVDDGLGPWGYAPLELDIDATDALLADFDGDGTTDVFVVGPSDGGDVLVQVARGTGEGASGTPFVPGNPQLVAWGRDSRAGDFDGDGALDVISFSNNDTIRVALADGAGSVSPPITSTSEDSIFPEFGVVVLDVDVDGRDDLVMPLGHSDGVGVMLANGDGTFTTGATLVQPACYVSNAVVVDLDADDVRDVVITGSCNAVPDDLPLSVYRGDGDQLVAGQMLYEGPGVYEGSDIVPVDLDADGDLDLVTGSSPSGLVTLQNDDGVLASPVLRAEASGVGARTLVAAQLETDAPIAFVIQNEFEGDAVVEQDDAETWSTTPMSLGGVLVGAEDLDADGRTDLVLVTIDGALEVWFSV